MDVSTFYALFSATCFTLVGLWWNVVQSHPEWLRVPARRRVVGGIYLSFLLPALMGLFAQVGGVEQPGIWRTGFVVVAVVGSASTLRLLSRERAEGGGDDLRWRGLGVAVLYALIAVVGVAPEIADVVNLRPIQAEALLLILLVVLAHSLVWRFMAGEGRSAESR
ncbi:hypothetical protein MTF65_01430 [Streptomyces sp. APSN-46.1]|uniref:hypothetical protein n=1 Tax=Streptomyces sp. APSN-46.1 TaxID=2929049 RepID=UPI001FB1C244|nr:hypothetical protein [Streptomyces sp. APSN-46.1]MCJ1676045.1 hypothetical protein [Streptomyces sp. APSN-46.1]